MAVLGATPAVAVFAHVGDLSHSQLFSVLLCHAQFISFGAGLGEPSEAEEKGKPEAAEPEPAGSEPERPEPHPPEAGSTRLQTLPQSALLPFGERKRSDRSRHVPGSFRRPYRTALRSRALNTGAGGSCAMLIVQTVFPIAELAAVSNIGCRRLHLKSLRGLLPLQLPCNVLTPGAPWDAEQEAL